MNATEMSMTRIPKSLQLAAFVNKYLVSVLILCCRKEGESSRYHEFKTRYQEQNDKKA